MTEHIDPITGTTPTEQVALDALTKLQTEAPEALVRLHENIKQLLTASVFPRLVEVTVEDDGEVWKALRCPVCDTLAGQDDLFDVSEADTWAYADDPEDDIEAGYQTLTFDYDVDVDLGDTLYLMHGDHPVSPPEGWTVGAR